MFQKLSLFAEGFEINLMQQPEVIFKHFLQKFSYNKAIFLNYF